MDRKVATSQGKRTGPGRWTEGGLNGPGNNLGFSDDSRMAEITRLRRFFRCGNSICLRMCLFTWLCVNTCVMFYKNLCFLHCPSHYRKGNGGAEMLNDYQGDGYSKQQGQAYNLKLTRTLFQVTQVTHIRTQADQIWIAPKCLCESSKISWNAFFGLLIFMLWCT